MFRIRLIASDGVPRWVRRGIGGCYDPTNSPQGARTWGMEKEAKRACQRAGWRFPGCRLLVEMVDSAPPVIK